jgi:hypothetical protein
MDLSLTFVLISGAYAVSQKRHQLVIASLVAFPMLAAWWSSYLLKIPSLDLGGNILGIGFFAYTMTIILAYLFREREVSADVIMGAVCVYLLLGLMWGLVFSVLETFGPGSFRFGEGQTTNVSNFIYYSFVTQTTLGYGDITPVSAPARSLSLLDAVAGQLYLAVLIARLVGMHIAQSSAK